MRIIHTRLAGAVIIEPRVHEDDRGFFLETWRRASYAGAGLPEEFAQDNVAVSVRGVLRGLHYQWPRPQGKLIQALTGQVHDVGVDLRVGSPTFGQSISVVLSSENRRQLYLPEGFAHGYAVISDTALVAYKCTTAYEPAADRAVRWNDPQLGIVWPFQSPILSAKDAAVPCLADIPRDELPSIAWPAAIPA